MHIERLLMQPFEAQLTAQDKSIRCWGISWVYRCGSEEHSYICSTPPAANRLLDFRYWRESPLRILGEWFNLIIVVASIYPTRSLIYTVFYTRAPFRSFEPIIAASQANNMHSEISWLNSIPHVAFGNDSRGGFILGFFDQNNSFALPRAWAWMMAFPCSGGTIYWESLARWTSLTDGSESLSG